MSRRCLFALGVAIMLVAIWGGAWLLADVPRSDWRHMPIAFTAFLVGVVGFLVVAVTIFKGRS